MNTLQIQVAVATVLSTESASKQDELAALAGTWDGEKRVVSKYCLDLHVPEHLPC